MSYRAALGVPANQQCALIADIQYGVADPQKRSFGQRSRKWLMLGDLSLRYRLLRQGAVSHQVALLERRLGARLFHRLPRGLALTDDGQALVPVLAETFDRVGAVLDQYADGRFREVINIGVVGTFATGWLLQRLDSFARTYSPH